MTDIKRCVKNMVQWNYEDVPKDLIKLAKELNQKSEFIGNLPYDIDYESPYAMKTTMHVNCDDKNCKTPNTKNRYAKNMGVIDQYHVGYFNWYYSGKKRKTKTVFFKPEIIFSYSYADKKIENSNLVFIEYSPEVKKIRKLVNEIKRCLEIHDDHTGFIKLGKEDIKKLYEIAKTQDFLNLES